MGNGAKKKKKKKKKKRKRKRAWEIDTDEENESENVCNDEKMKVSERELMGYKRKFELFSEKATLLFANGDHNIYEQTRDSLIARIKVVADKKLFDEQKKEAAVKRVRFEKSKKEQMDDMLAGFDDD